jgi:CubicO group peptidase (beta-lactamase class C family)
MRIPRPTGPVSRGLVSRGLSSSGLLLVLVLAAGVLPPAPAFAQSPEAVDRIFAQWDLSNSPGCAVGVAVHGETVLDRAYGMAELEHDIPNTPGTIFEAGSVSKQFTAAAIVLLALEGKLSLDDDVRRHVPEVPDYGTPVRIRHLLTHTSGLRDWGSVAAIAGWGRGDRSHSHAHVLDLVGRQSALNYPPGQQYSYTNTGYNLMAVIVERVSGLSFAEFSRERIFEPAGMADTQWRDDYRRIVPGRATGYSPSGETFRINHPIEDVHGNGGLLTTVRDLLTWDEALRTGSFGGAEFLELMHRQGVLTDGRTIGYASGLQLGVYRGVPRVSHTGSTAGYRAYLGRYPDQALSVAILCNASNANPGSLGNQVADVYLGDLPEPGSGPVAQGIPVDPGVLEARAGLYRELDTGEPRRLVVENGELRVQGGGALVARSESEFETGSGGVQYRFGGAEEGGTRSPFQLLEDGHLVGEYLPVPEFEPTPAQLHAYVGEFHSEDAETTLRVTEEDGRLILHRRPDTHIPLTPVYPDAFQGSLGLIRFHRSPAGGVMELSVRQERVHDLRFARVGGR